MAEDAPSRHVAWYPIPARWGDSLRRESRPRMLLDSSYHRGQIAGADLIARSHERMVESERFPYSVER
jgi:hypothetical protein